MTIPLIDIYRLEAALIREYGSSSLTMTSTDPACCRFWPKAGISRTRLLRRWPSCATATWMYSKDIMEEIEDICPYVASGDTTEASVTVGTIERCVQLAFVTLRGERIDL